MDDYREMTDKALILLLKQGNQQAFAEIYDRYSMLIYHKVNQMLRDPQASEDIIQDIFGTLWEKPEFLREDANLAGYLYIISRNMVLRLIQRGKTNSDYLAELGKYSSEVSFDTLEKIDEKELILLIIQEIGNLPPKMREVFQLSRLENLSHKEIALKLNISEATVRKQVQYALGILRNRLSIHSPYGILLLVFFRGS